MTTLHGIIKKMAKNVTTSITTDTMSESSALKEILGWSRKRSKWQRDALRRLIINDGVIDNTAIDELYQICTGETETYEPLQEMHIVPESIKGEPVSILSISNPVGINALAEYQTLKFSPTGLTVVYGDNGSGKSGYVRILKHACRSRDSDLLILPDINKPDETKQSAHITYRRDSIDETSDWNPEMKKNSFLAAVSIFDSKSAITHLDKDHSVAYTPFPMMILRELSWACDKLKKKAEQEISSLKSQTPEVLRNPTLNPETKAGKFLATLSAGTKKTELQKLLSLNNDEISRHATLKADLTGNSQQNVAKIVSLKSRFEEKLATLLMLLDASSDENLKIAENLRNDYETKMATAKAASEEIFSTSPLPNIGEELWRNLWEAAREYSDCEAYTKTSFPHFDLDQELCVLCQQPLSKDIIERWNTFEEFIKSKTKISENEAEEAYIMFISNSSSARMTHSDIQSICKLVRNELGNNALAEELRVVALTASKRLRELIANKTASMPHPAMPRAKIDSEINKLDSRILQIKAGGGSDIRKAVVSEFQELEGRLFLKSIESDIKAETSRLKQILKLEHAIKLTAKIAITNKNKELSDKLVTAALQSRFTREMEKLDVITMPVEIRKDRDRNAQSFFKVGIQGKPDRAVGDILSEGEHRYVALAAFLAELVTSREYSGIVFDDPMSSLDHIYRTTIAKRLVEESRHRQVIIFTHDLTFLFEVNRQAEEQDRQIHFQTVRRRSDKPGFVECGLPFKAKQAGAMENGIRSLLKTLKGQFDDKHETERSVIAKGVIAQIREAWEQGIADFINPVIARFDSHVKPSSLFKLLVLDDEDVKAVLAARSRLSNDIHSSPETLNPADVEHKDLVAELDKLQSWLECVREKQRTATIPS